MDVIYSFNMTTCCHLVSVTLMKNTKRYSMKKLLTINGSYTSDGNTQTIISHIHRGAVKSSYKCITINLIDYKLKYCQSCKVCNQTGTCPLDDDFMSMVASIKEADVIIFASPLWHHAVTGLMKVFIDRLNTSQLSFTVKNDKAQIVSRIPTKRSVALLVGCTQDLTPALPTMNCLLNTLGFDAMPPLLFPSIGLTAEQTAGRLPAMIKEAFLFGQSL